MKQFVRELFIVAAAIAFAAFFAPALTRADHQFL